jgi:nitroreductase
MKYEDFLELLKYRRTIRSFKPDPIPEDYVTKILDAAHYAMSGANSQPWEFIVVKETEMKKKVVDAYLSTWNVSTEEKDKVKAMMGGWGVAPVYLLILYDPRKMFGSVMAARMILDKTLFSSMGHLSMVVHLAAASLGLGAQRVSIVRQTPFREILGYPEPLELDCIVPLGYRNYEPGPPLRFPTEELVHFDKYNMGKYLRDEDFLKYLERIRKLVAMPSGLRWKG